ncbi:MULTISPECIES: MarR family winged helix-turn-helix transcriptional regulator [Mycobacteriaceae]|jgi:DNA-binding MarR family transcriptional regulator|uniref:DNA-binding transcriptional regulator, MarR family n=2 Tax=Mycolicibacterium fluoranthenivorans TaxID=258505 RepID=A0A1G4W406_9MYCO|nr:MULTISPECIES: MarR family transcriptional regulator [Mycobacteriaceae]MCV7251417.1 MarR family transcriptional regulator [Mycobacterium hackensackense]MCV7357202.1 MarR family transcriptional regulator [Mycolicibacterium fluoranthenivorans]SCX16388.1 DNA-binding transcriptional regulator, MarR family [Mycolicibacterium fluoranthenivorans]
MLDMGDALDDLPLGYLLHRAAMALRSEVTTSVLEPLDLTFAQYLCMRILSKAPGSSNAELARQLNVSPQAMNMVVRGLEDRGLVSRPASVASGRALPAELSREGVAILSRTDSGVRAAELQVLGNLAEDERSQLKRILAAVGE